MAISTSLRPPAISKESKGRYKAFLDTSYPLFNGACELFLDTLAKHPKFGWTVTCQSLSPEHGGVVAGPAMDNAILRDLFAQTAEATATE